MIIDAHTHCFPDSIAPRAILSLQKNSGNLRNYTDGTASDLIRNMDSEGIDYSFVLNIATNPKQMHHVNAFAKSLIGTRLIPFASVHPDSPEIMEELEWIKASGIPGIKFHPEYQGFFVDDARMKPVYKKISALGLITVFHAGYDIGYGFPVHASPVRMRRALAWFDSPVIAAYWGGWCSWNEVLKRLCATDILFDTSFSQGTMPTPIAQRILDRHGSDRIVFGSDSPWHSPSMDLGLLSVLSMDKAQLDRILWKNALSLLDYAHYQLPAINDSL